MTKQFRIYKNLYFVLFLTVAFTSCKIPELGKLQNVKTLPDSFPAHSMHSESELLSWKLFFNDSLLLGLIDSALANNPDLQIAAQRLQMASNDYRQARGAMLPVAGANLAYSQRKFGYYTMDDAGNRTTYILPGQFVPTHLPDFFAGFQASWEADMWGKLKSRKKAARSRFFASIEGVNLATTAVVSEVALIYFELQALDEELNTIRRAIIVQQAALEVVRLQKEASVTTELAVKQFEAQVLNSRSLEHQTLQKIAMHENRMHALLGRFSGRIARQSMQKSNGISDSLIVGLPSRLLGNRPDIRQAEHELIAAGFDLRSAKAAFYPSITLSGFVGSQSFRSGFLLDFPKSLAYSALSGITAPLVNRTAIKAQFRNAGARQQEALSRFNRTVIQGYLEVATELSNISNLKAYTSLKKMEVLALNQSVVISDDLFRTGKANYLEVLMIQHNALISGLEMTEAEKYRRQAAVNLYRALGGGWK